MASVVFDAYVVSFNRVGLAKGGTRFGGVGFAFAPRPKSSALHPSPLQVFGLDPQVSASARREYPCYVPEL